MVSDPWSHLPLTDLSYQILLSLAPEPLHGYAILKAIRARTDGRLEPESGTLYTAIRRLRRDGLVEVDAAAPAGRRGRSYGLTEEGRAVLALESQRLSELIGEARRAGLLKGAAKHG